MYCTFFLYTCTAIGKVTSGSSWVIYLKEIVATKSKIWQGLSFGRKRHFSLKSKIKLKVWILTEEYSKTLVKS